jgi:hypothetical protein
MITKAHERMAEGGQRSLRRSQAENPIDKPDSRCMGSSEDHHKTVISYKSYDQASLFSDDPSAVLQ